MILFDDVSVSYGEDVKGLSNFSMHVREGECLLLTSASGSGKTTITRCINGLARHFYECNLTGNIRICGKDIMDLEMYEISRLVGSVFQDPRTQFFTLNPFHELIFSSENYGMQKEQILARLNELVTSFSIAHLMDKNIYELSSGEKQKIAIVSALMLQPKILVLDEPTANLDFLATAELRELLLKIKSMGTTIVISEHNFYWLKDLCDTVVLLQKGVKQWEKKASDFFGSNLMKQHNLRKIDPFDSVLPEAEARAEKRCDVKHVSFYYKKKKPVLADINVTIDMGKINILVGQNGSGKTTFSKVLAGLYKEKKGMILRDSVRYSSKKRLENTFYVMQDADYQLVSETVLEEMMMGCSKNETLQEKVEKILERFGLLELKERHPSTLSGGEKQRLTIALAFMKGSDFIYLDEPTSGLDGGNMRNLIKMLQEHTNAGGTILVISHDIEFIFESGEKIIYLSSSNEAEEIYVSKENSERIKQILVNSRGA